MGWIEFIVAFAVFFASHMLPVRPHIRERIERVTGTRGFSIIYSVLSLAVLAWLIGAAGRAPYIEIWPWAAWEVHVTHAAMLTACMILGLSLGRPNPFSFGGGSQPFDPVHPGLVRWMRHPVLVAMTLWAGAHLLVNGALAHVILFGLFCGFSVIGQGAIDRRKQREMGPDWRTLNSARRSQSSARTAFGRNELVLRLLAGLLLFALLLVVHPLFFGVSALALTLF
ncbi:MAG: NnrU family protein [Pseudomonadota bacterium]